MGQMSMGLSLSSVVLRGGAREATPWYLTDTITVDDVVAAYQPYEASSLANSYVNVANPGTYDAAPGLAPTFGLGWEFNGSTTYLTTGITAGQNWSAIVSVANVTDGCAFGTDASTDRRFYLWARLGSDLVYGGGGFTVVNPYLESGTMAIAGHQGYRDGSSEGAATAAYAGDPPHALLIGAMAKASDGSALQFLNGSILYLSVYNRTLTAAEVSDLDSNIGALLI